jgi:AraC-like DNA-binding protein
MDITVNKVINVHHTEGSDWLRDIFAPRKHQALVAFTEGEIEYHFESLTLTAKKGDILLLPGNLPYSGKKLSQTVSLSVIDFDCNTPTEFSELFAPAVVTPLEFSAVCIKFTKALELWRTKPIDADLQIKSIIYDILCDVIKSKHTGGRLTPTADIVEYILQNLDDASLCVKSLCKKFYISESQLSRNFVKYTGTKPNEYLLNARINQAKNLLVFTTESVQDIAQKCGFSSPYYFSRCFSKAVGVSPLEFRKQNYNFSV